MDDTSAMGLDESGCDLGRMAQDQVEWQSTARETGGQSLAVHELHDQEVEAVVLANVMQSANVRVVEAGDHACFALEPLSRFRAMQHSLRQHLHGYGAVEPNIPGSIDLAHTSRAERRLDLVRAETRAGDDGHGQSEL